MPGSLRTAGKLGKWSAEVALLYQCLFSCFDEGGICPPDSWAAGVLPSLDSPARVVWQTAWHW